MEEISQVDYIFNCISQISEIISHIFYNSLSGINYRTVLGRNNKPFDEKLKVQIRRRNKKPKEVNSNAIKNSSRYKISS